jgi:glycosyltransferase involved in cell wall biosynthesis
VSDGETGLLIGPDDPDALARAVNRVLDAPGEYGERGLARARTEFSVEKMTNRTLGIYETALAGTSLRV